MFDLVFMFFFEIVQTVANKQDKLGSTVLCDYGFDKELLSRFLVMVSVMLF